MKKQFVIYRLQPETYSLGLFTVDRFDTEPEAIAFLEKQVGAQITKSAYYQPDRYLILPEYVV